jgi:hypothetical protein
MIFMETRMEILETPPTVPPDITADLQLAADRAARGVRDPEAMRLACERMDRMRAETFRAYGLLEVGVPAIRALRDGE